MTVLNFTLQSKYMNILNGGDSLNSGIKGTQLNPHSRILIDLFTKDEKDN
jgi:hypothetical protein